jgi:hypothetical protein
MLHRTIVAPHHCCIAPLLHRTIVASHHCCIAPLLHRTISHCETAYHNAVRGALFKPHHPFLATPTGHDLGAPQSMSFYIFFEKLRSI